MITASLENRPGTNSSVTEFMPEDDTWARPAHFFWTLLAAKTEELAQCLVKPYYFNMFEVVPQNGFLLEDFFF